MKLRWTVRALDDRKSIFDYIEVDSLRAAIAIDDRIEEQVIQLLQTPEIGRAGRVSGTRELIINRTPYIAAYTTDGDTVRVLRVLHGAQQWPDVIDDGNG